MLKHSVLLILFQIIFLSGCAKSINFYSDVEHLKYNSTIDGTISKPEGDGPFPAVVLMHGCSGLVNSTKQALNAHSDNLVSNGFVTLILNSFTKRGKSDSVCGDTEALEEAHNYRQYDAFHALKYLQTQPYVDKNNIFLMGQSNGGGVALSIAKFGADKDLFPDKPKFQGIVAFYPPCGYISNIFQSEIISPLLILTGEKDDWTPPAECLSAKKYVTGSNYEVIVYKNAYHSFDLFISEQTYAGHTVGGNYIARNDSHKQMLNWFLRHLSQH
ncbi:MAG: prolyl oligopeptidase family serine peptidase [Helicobacteraceae bacterium]|nr:prolyl oligopeptidase family serine peptidase [Helicobacteraceae bacterium]